MNENIVSKYKDLTIKLSKKFGRFHQHNIEGIKSTALLTLCEISDDLANQDNKEGYLANTIRDRVQSFIASDRAIPTNHKALQRGTNQPPVTYEHHSLLKSRLSKSEQDCRVSELLEDAKLTHKQTEVLDCLASGLSLEETREAIGRGEQQILLYRKQIAFKIAVAMTAGNLDYRSFK